MAPLLSTFTTLLVLLAAGSALAATAAAGRGGGQGQNQGPSRGSQTRFAARGGEAGQQGHMAATVVPPSSSDPNCTTPLVRPGYCIRLQACKPLLDLLRAARIGPKGMPDAEAKMLLRRSQCGFQGFNVMVCCPSVESDGGGSYNSASSYEPRPELSREPSRPMEPPSQNNAYGSAAPDLALSLQPATSRPAPNGHGHASGGGDSSFDFTTPAPASTPALSSYPDPYPAADSDPYPARKPLHPKTQGEDSAAVEQGGAPVPSTGSGPDLPWDHPHYYPAENLALLPAEVCGLMLHPGQPGGNRTGLMQYPWMARLGYRQGDSDTTEYLCSGSLISERYVLTSAHCVGVLNGPTSVRLGDSDSATDPDCVDSMCAPGVVDVAVEESVAHEGHRRGVDDIALLRLARPVVFTEAVSPICIPVPVQNMPEEDATGRTMTVAGWGNSSPNKRQHSPNRWLLQHRVQVLPPSTCHVAYDALDDVRFSSEKHLCVGGGCHGDSGSPLMLTEVSGGDGADTDVADRRALLYGVLSYGLPDCALRGAPIAFTRVAHFVPWLLRSIRPNPFVPKDRISGSGIVDPRRGMGGYRPKH